MDVSANGTHNMAKLRNTIAAVDTLALLTQKQEIRYHLKTQNLFGELNHDP